ncbi:MAG: 30S ribosome-binding factor RbfA [Halanaerobiaceae bacterium]
MTRQRARRLGELIKQEISDIILKEVKDPRIGFVSITDVEVSGDLRHANVFVSVYGTEKEKKETMEGLKKANGFIRKLIGERITVYHTPELFFKYDQSIEHGVYISQLIDEVKKDNNNEGEDR